jgi:hypothetical protein
MLKLLEMSFQCELSTKDHFNIFVNILPEYPFNMIPYLSFCINILSESDVADIVGSNPVKENSSKSRGNQADFYCN